jgi:hypothetical protein
MDSMLSIRLPAFIKSFALPRKRLLPVSGNRNNSIYLAGRADGVEISWVMFSEKLDKS